MIFISMMMATTIAPRPRALADRTIAMFRTDDDRPSARDAAAAADRRRSQLAAGDPTRATQIGRRGQLHMRRYESSHC
jgi:hypothetical protein